MMTDKATRDIYQRIYNLESILIKIDDFERRLDHLERTFNIRANLAEEALRILVGSKQ